MTALWSHVTRVPRPFPRDSKLHKILFALHEVFVRKGGPLGYQVLNAHRLMLCRPSARPEISTLTEDVIADLADPAAAEAFGRRFLKQLRSRFPSDSPLSQ